MKTIELFSGTGSFSKIAKEKGHNTFCIDKFKNLGQLDLQVDLETWDPGHIKADFIWASPPCTTFSVASMGFHWTGGKGAYIPKTEKCKQGLRILENTIKIISIIKPKYFVIENPRGVMRKVIDDLFIKYNINNVIRKTVTYCQYGDNRMKPTDLWINFEWETKPMCKNGSPCHVAAPRGSRTGTQGLKNNKERSVIPPALFEELFNQLK
jgi:site-specific DNA-cytosine methylase